MDWLDGLIKVSQVGSVTLLAIAVYGAVRGYWVPRWIYDEKTRENERLEAQNKALLDAILAGSKAVESATTVLAKRPTR